MYAISIASYLLLSNLKGDDLPIFLSGDFSQKINQVPGRGHALKTYMKFKPYNLTTLLQSYSHFGI